MKKIGYVLLLCIFFSSTAFAWHDRGLSNTRYQTNTVIQNYIEIPLSSLTTTQTNYNTDTYYQPSNTANINNDVNSAYHCTVTYCAGQGNQTDVRQTSVYKQPQIQYTYQNTYDDYQNLLKQVQANHNRSMNDIAEQCDQAIRQSHVPGAVYCTADIQRICQLKRDRANQTYQQDILNLKKRFNIQ